MNRIIITGHPDSGYGKVESLLLACGMKPPSPSTREGLLPADIHQILRKIHPIPDLHAITEEKGFQPLDVNPTHREMAKKLLSDNKADEVWGWADPEALFFLDYWHAADPQCLFVLVYDDPSSVLRPNTFDDKALADAEKVIRCRLDNWAAYNGTMLRFFFEHMDRCVLHHANRLQTDSEAILKELQSRIHTTPIWRNPGTGMANDRPVFPGNEDSPEADLLPTAEAIDRFLAECHMDFHTVHGGLYDELQTVAHLPLVCKEDHATCGPDLLKARILERKEFGSLVRQLTQRSRNLEQQQRRLTAEHELTLLQHAQACEEMGHVLLENHSLRIELKERSKPPAPAPLTGAAERVKQQLSYRLGAIMVAKAKSPLGIITMPFALILEILFFNREKVTRRKENLPPLQEYADFHLAAKVKRQLSYRLGNTLVRRGGSPSGWIVLPFALLRQIQAFHRNRPTAP